MAESYKEEKGNKEESTKEEITLKEEYFYLYDIKGLLIDIRDLLKESLERERELDKRKREKAEKRESKAFKKPTVEEVREFCEENGYDINPKDFVNYYDMVGWVVGNNKKKMDSWKAAVANWAKNQKEWAKEKASASQSSFLDELANIKQDDPTDWGLGF